MTPSHLIDLSHTIVTDMAQWPGDDQSLRLRRLSVHENATYMNTRLEFGCHVGTHIDAPLHFLAGAPGVDAMPLDRFIGPAVVIRCGDGAATGPLAAELLDGVDLAGIDFVLFDTDWSRHWGTDLYYARWSFLGPALAERLAGAGLKGVGLDTPSLDGFDSRIAHDLFAAAGMVNIENLTNLGALPTRGFGLQVLPLKLHQTEASPVRAVAWLEP